MASNALYRYSAAAEYAASQWESVAKRAYYTIQEDGSVLLVDLTQTMTSKVEIRTASEPIKDQIKSSRQSYFDEKLKDDLDDFDDMVTELNKQEAPIKNSQLIDALFISLRLRKHITNPKNGEKNVDVAHYDKMVAQFNEQEKPFSNSQLIAVFSASLKLRQYVIKLATSSTTNQSFNDELTDMSAAALEQKTTVDKSDNLLTKANQCSSAAVDYADRKCDKLLNIDMDFKKTKNDATALINPSPSLQQQLMTNYSTLAVIVSNNSRKKNKKRRNKQKSNNMLVAAVRSSIDDAVDADPQQFTTSTTADYVPDIKVIVEEQLTEAQAAFMAECELEFVNRYTDYDCEYEQLKKKQISDPPIFSFERHQLIAEYKRVSDDVSIITETKILPVVPVFIFAISADEHQPLVIPLSCRFRPCHRLLLLRPNLTAIREVDEYLAKKNDDKWLVGFCHEQSTREIRYLYNPPQEEAVQLRAADRRIQHEPSSPFAASDKVNSAPFVSILERSILSYLVEQPNSIVPAVNEDEPPMKNKLDEEQQLAEFDQVTDEQIDNHAVDNIQQFVSLHVNDASRIRPMPNYMKGTISYSAKCRIKVPPNARSGFNNFTKNRPGIPTIPLALSGSKKAKCTSM